MATDARSSVSEPRKREDETIRAEAETSPDETDVAKVLFHGFRGSFPPAKTTIPDQGIDMFQTNTASGSKCVTPEIDRKTKRESQEADIDPKQYHSNNNKVAEAQLTTVKSTAELFPPFTSEKALGADDSGADHQQPEGLRLLSTIVSTSTNTLMDQIKYLPDSRSRPVELSYDERDEDKLDNQVIVLRKVFDYLLWGADGMERADFLAVPKDVLELLRDVWNLNENPSMTDRVERRLVPVQSFFPNLLNTLLQTPGFPIVSDVFDSNIFRAFGKAKVKRIEKTLKDLIRETLERMGYPCDGQEISFYLSFMKTKKRTIVQDPHIDFKWETVDPWYIDDSPARKSKRGRKLDYKERTPFIAFFPLTPDGMAVEVWQARDDHRTGRDGVLVHIPFGCMMIARGDVVHAGGFSSSSHGNPRSHLYIYRSGGEVHDINTSNTYTKEVEGKTVRLSQLYKHGPGI